jgi:hypothetical protein
MVTCLIAQTLVQGNTKADNAILGSMGVVNKTKKDRTRKAFEGTLRGCSFQLDVKIVNLALL